MWLANCVARMFVLTLYNLYSNWNRYLEFDSIINEKHYDFYGSKSHNIPIVFPILIVCANSMHSKAKATVSTHMYPLHSGFFVQFW